MKKTKKILIEGYYGVHNLGDDYILLSLLNQLEEYYSQKKENVEVKIISRGDAYSELLYQFPHLLLTVTILKKNPFINLLIIEKEISHSTIYIYGGGGLFPRCSVGKLTVFLFKLRAAKIFKSSVIIYGVDMAFAGNKKTNSFWRRILALADLIVLRNSKSADYLSQICPTEKKKIIDSVDLTFSFKIKDEEYLESYLLSKYHLIPDKYIIWCIARPWSNEEMADIDHINRYKKYLNQIKDKIVCMSNDGFTNIFLPFFYENDIKVYEDLIKENCSLLLPDQLNTLEYRPLFKNAHLVVSSRFHGTAFALYYGTPFVSISYSPKTSDLLSEFGLDSYYVELGIRKNECYYRINDIDDEKLNELFDRIKTDYTKDCIIGASKKIMLKAEKSKEALFSFLSSN